MSNREMAIGIINKIPEYKLIYAIDMLNGLLYGYGSDDKIEKVEPDEWDLEMIAEAEAVNDGATVTLDELLAKDGFTYADLQG